MVSFQLNIRCMHSPNLNAKKYIVYSYFSSRHDFYNFDAYQVEIYTHTHTDIHINVHSYRCRYRKRVRVEQIACITAVWYVNQINSVLYSIMRCLGAELPEKFWASRRRRGDGRGRRKGVGKGTTQLHVAFCVLNTNGRNLKPDKHWAV